MQGGLVDAITQAYRDPRRVMARLMADGPSEPRSLFHLMLAAGILFVASLPNAIRAAQRLEIDDAQTGAIAAHLFGYVFLLPLLVYALAALVHLVARGFGGRGGFGGARAAVFWSALLGAPIALILALLGAGVEAATGRGQLLWLDLLGYAGLGFWLWLFAANIAEAEGFAITRVLLTVGIGFGVVASGLAVVSGSLTVAG